MFSLILYLRGKQELTGIEVMGGAGERLMIFMVLVLQQLGGGLWLNKNYSRCGAETQRIPLKPSAIMVPSGHRGSSSCPGQ